MPACRTTAAVIKARQCKKGAPETDGGTEGRREGGTDGQAALLKSILGGHRPRFCQASSEKDKILAQPGIFTPVSYSILVSGLFLRRLKLGQSNFEQEKVVYCTHIYAGLDSSLILPRRGLHSVSPFFIACRQSLMIIKEQLRDGTKIDMPTCDRCLPPTSSHLLLGENLFI